MVCQGMQREPAATDTVDDIRVRHALTMMANRLHDPIPITELAQRLQLSTRHVERLFQGAVGARPGTVYRTMRLRHAQWMLNNTRHPITSIAIDTGFSDGAHFSRQFKQMTGISPREARRRSAGEPVLQTGHATEDKELRIIAKPVRDAAILKHLTQHQNRRSIAHDGS